MFNETITTLTNLLSSLSREEQDTCLEILSVYASIDVRGKETLADFANAIMRVYLNQ